MKRKSLVFICGLATTALVATPAPGAGHHGGSSGAIPSVNAPPAVVHASSAQPSHIARSPSSRVAAPSRSLGSDWRHRHHHHYYYSYWDPWYPYSYWDWDYYPYGYYSYYGEPGYETGGSLVVQVQSELADQGYYHGTIDGIIGPQTRAAIRAYERDHRLPVNGVINRSLISEMDLG